MQKNKKTLKGTLPKIQTACKGHKTVPPSSSRTMWFGFLEGARPQADLGLYGQLLSSAGTRGETQMKPDRGGTAEAGEMRRLARSLPLCALQQQG